MSKPLFRLGYEPIDADHEAFVSLISELEKSDNVAFPTLFRKLLEHTEQHFARENELMERHGFPSILEHKGEHARVLGELHQFDKRVQRGFLEFGRAFVRERLTPWFELHIITMDSALSAHLQKLGV